MKSLTDKYAAGIEGHRKLPRYAVPWRIVVVYKKMGRHESYQGSICDLSMGGLSFFADLNIHSAEPVVVTIEIPAYMRDQKNTIVGARCAVLHSVLSTNYGKFRIGLKFLDFNGKGQGDLSKALSRMVAINDSSQPYYK